MHKFHRFWALLSVLALLGGAARADEVTLHPKNGQPVTGEPFQASEVGIRLKLSDPGLDNPYMPKAIPWGALTQDDLKALQAQYATNQSRDAQAAMQYIEPFIAIPIAEKLQKTQLDTTNEAPRLKTPKELNPGSIFAALGTSSAGMLMLLLLYAGNLFAAYEISVFRAQPVALVCGLAAVVPIVGPIIFLALPRREPQGAAEVYDAPDENLEAAIAAEQAAPAAAAHPHAHAAPRHPTTQSIGAAAGAAPAGKVFARGQFTFNRRFFETQMPGFFAVMRPAADKDTTLIFKSARGTFVAERITRATATEVTITVRKGTVTEEVVIPFTEIQEVQLKHKDA